MKHTQQRGSILIYSLLTMTMMLAIGLTLTSLFINKLKSAGQARDSVAALYTADSATEACIYSARRAAKADLVMENGATFTITNTADQSDITTDCTILGSTSFGFRATGIYRAVQRTLEISQ